MRACFESLVEAWGLKVRRRSIGIRSDSGDGEMAAIEFGPQDRPIDVVFLHANGFNARTYSSVLAPLGGEMRILAVDQRGHGRTSLEANPEGRSSWIDFRDDLLGLLEALAGPPVVISGHSMGCCVSLLAAAVAPERIRRMAFFEPVIMPRGMGDRMASGLVPRHAIHDSPMVQGALRRRSVFASREAAVVSLEGRGAFRTWSRAQIADYAEDGFRETPEGVELTCAPTWEASNYSSQAHDPWPGLDHFPRPIHIFRSEEGSTARIDDELPALIDRGLHIETVPGTSHFLPMERPHVVRTALREAVTADT
jgi:pimeloyl-ACP methyl ester carboxylesterase